MELPAEIRLIVYEYALVATNPIEFWAETGDSLTNYICRHRDIKNIGTSLALLRTNKVVNNEATEIFYGKNEFRFSGLNCCIMASAFLYTLTPRNSQWLTNITIAMPFRTDDRLQLVDYRKPSSWAPFTDILRGSGFRYPEFVVNDRANMVGLRERLLLPPPKPRKSTKFKKLTLVMPNKYFRFGCHNFRIWNAIKGLVAAKPALDVVVVLMYRRRSWGIRPMLPEQGKVLQELAMVVRVEYELAYYNQKGR